MKRKNLFLLLGFVFVSWGSLFLGYRFGVEDTTNMYKITPEGRKLLTECMIQNAEWMRMVIQLKYGNEQRQNTF